MYVKIALKPSLIQKMNAFMNLNLTVCGVMFFQRNANSLLMKSITLTSGHFTLDGFCEKEVLS